MVLIIIVLCDLIPEVVPENSDLNCPACDKIVISNRRPIVRFQEDHQEAESNEYHNMNVLEHRVNICHTISNDIFSSYLVVSAQLIISGCTVYYLHCICVRWLVVTWGLRVCSLTISCEQAEEENCHELTQNETYLGSAIVKHGAIRYDCKIKLILFIHRLFFKI